MKTTLIINDQVMRRLKMVAAREKKTISELVESAIRFLLSSERKPVKSIKSLPVFHGGRLRVDISDRDALYRLMEEDGV